MADDEMQTPDDDAAEDEETASPGGDASLNDDAAPTDDLPDAEAASDDEAVPDEVAADEESASDELVASDEAVSDDDVASVEDGAISEDEAVSDDEAAAEPAASGGGEPISQDDIDELFAEQGNEPAPPANDRPAGGGATEVDAAAVSLLGDDAVVLIPFGAKARETLSLGVESAMGQSATIAGVTVAGGEYSEIEQEFAGIPHLGFELRVSLSETESHLVGALIPLPDSGALFSIDTAPDQMSDESYAQTQVETAAATMRELLDLVSLTLFTEGLSAAEVSLSDQRVDQIEFTMGIVADVAQGATPLRIDVVLALPGGIPVTVTLVVPSSLVTRIAETIAESDAAVAEAAPIGGAEAIVGAGAPITGAAFDAGAGFDAGAAEEAPRPAATIGGSPDVEAHPVRFPPLPQLEAPVTAQRGLELIMDVQMRVAVELGRSTMTVEDVLSLGPGSVVELNKLAGEAVDILVNERLIARGEVVVVDENFGVRVTEIVSPRRRAHAMSA